MRNVSWGTVGGGFDVVQLADFIPMKSWKILCQCWHTSCLVLKCNCTKVSLAASVTRKKSPNVYKSCPKIISLEIKILTPLQKLPKNVGYSGKLIVATGFKNLPKVQ